jgi:flagellar P-ring protein precursor FlgI
MASLSVFAGALLAAFALSAASALADPPPTRVNQFVGFGLVVGLKGTGDDLAAPSMAAQALQARLKPLPASGDDLSAYRGKIAFVMVTTEARVDPSEEGSVDLVITPASSAPAGGATSLAGGRLLGTLLAGVDGRVYFLGQGELSACPPRLITNCDAPVCKIAQCIPGGGVRFPAYQPNR